VAPSSEMEKVTETGATGLKHCASAFVPSITSSQPGVFPRAELGARFSFRRLRSGDLPGRITRNSFARSASRLPLAPIQNYNLPQYRQPVSRRRARRVTK
jgi:hypothetical protein